MTYFLVMSVMGAIACLGLIGLYWIAFVCLWVLDVWAEAGFILECDKMARQNGTVSQDDTAENGSL